MDGFITIQWQILLWLFINQWSLRFDCSPLCAGFSSSKNFGGSIGSRSCNTRWNSNNHQKCWYYFHKFLDKFLSIRFTFCRFFEPFHTQVTGQQHSIMILVWTNLYNKNWIILIVFIKILALLRLDKPVKVINKLRPVCLPPRGKSFTGRNVSHN